MKKIALITFPAGGPFVWAKNLQKHLIPKGYHCQLFSGRKDYLLAQLRYFDLVHTCVPVPNLLTKKYILTIHGNYLEEKHLSQYLFPVCIKRAAVVTTPSQFLKQTLHLKNALVIPNGIDLPDKIKTVYDYQQKTPRLGLLTNFNFRPKAEGALTLAQIIKKIAPAAELIIAGNGQYLAEFQQKILAVNKNVRFLGFCPKEKLFKQIDIFTYYSFLDNQPLAIMEAMAYGLPVISNQVGAVKELFLSPLENLVANDENSYGQILQEFIQSKDRRQAAGLSALKIAQQFSWPKIVEQFIELY